MKERESNALAARPNTIDLLTGITAHQRNDGGYLVFVEEDFKAKVLTYRWKP